MEKAKSDFGVMIVLFGCIFIVFILIVVNFGVRGTWSATSTSSFTAPCDAYSVGASYKGGKITSKTSIGAIQCNFVYTVSDTPAPSSLPTSDPSSKPSSGQPSSPSSGSPSNSSGSSSNKGTPCVTGLNVPSYKVYRANGHQSQSLSLGSYSSEGGAVPSSCFSASSSGAVSVGVSSSGFSFTPKGVGTGSAVISVSADCTCSGSAMSRSVSFTFTEWGLRSLKIKGYDISPEFYNMTMEYTAIVPNSVTSLEIEAVANDRGSKIKITGHDNLQVGENEVIITVTTPESISRDYIIKVTRSTSNDVPGASSSSSSS
ncbi:MAG: cadherin-like beta sandwich domain-containing protein, partial [Bacilli bacterium]|nr:cadherin-like beta sandwich domain-containing protein [Bacilli bacterium]